MRNSSLSFLCRPALVPLLVLLTNLAAWSGAFAAVPLENVGEHEKTVVSVGVQS